MSTSRSEPMKLFKSDEGRRRYLEAYDAVLRDWPVSYEEIDLSTRFGTTHVIAAGRPGAPPLVLLPSLAGSATLWRPNVEFLSRHFRTYAVDVIGQVGKSVPTRRIRSRQDCADWLVDVLDALAVPRVSIVGSSYGGFLALNQASLTPDRVDRVVLISPAGTFVGLSLRFYVMMLIRLPLRMLRPSRRPPSIGDMLGNEPPLKASDASWAALMSVTMTESARPNTISPIVLGQAELDAIDAEVLLLVGDRERLYDASRTLRLAAERMPRLTGEIVPNAHHLAALAQPDTVNARIMEFLTTTGRARRVVETAAASSS